MNKRDAKRDMEKMLEQYPLFLSSQDLVELGIYSSLDAVYLARVRSNSPKYIKLKHKILYPKAAVIEFLIDRMK